MHTFFFFFFSLLNRYIIKNNMLMPNNGSRKWKTVPKIYSTHLIQFKINIFRGFKCTKHIVVITVISWMPHLMSWGHVNFLLQFIMVLASDIEKQVIFNNAYFFSFFFSLLNRYIIKNNMLMPNNGSQKCSWLETFIIQVVTSVAFIYT